MPNREETRQQTAASRPVRQKATEPAGTATVPPRHALTVTVPLDRAIDIATPPIVAARRVLTAKGGLPLYLGLGVLAVADVIDWPVAAAAGVGYAVLRRWGPLRPAQSAPKSQQAQ
ncbi:MAG: hypothetical protein ACM3ML_17455 [Micromonosporaceae bacterium]